MARPKVNLKDPVLAAILAFLLPGMGHFYQRRIFKGLLYCVCILGTFFTGLRIGHGQVVYFHWKNSENRTYAYLCQFWVGLPALPALAQSQLRPKSAFDLNYLPEPISRRFEGTLTLSERGAGRDPLAFSGTIELKPPREGHGQWSADVAGTLTTDDGARKIHGKVAHGKLEPEVAPWSKRRIADGRFEGEFDDRPGELINGELEGAIPRSLWDSYEAPLQDSPANDLQGEQSDLNRAHRELGGRFELGVVYTMIAGLLNILAIYDALEGPAYEDEEEGTQTDTPPPTPDPPPA
jgi:hypothetical protein